MTTEAASATGTTAAASVPVGSVTFSGATANGANLGTWQLWTDNLPDMRGVQEGSISALSNNGRQFTATWLSTSGTPAASTLI